MINKIPNFMVKYCKIPIKCFITPVPRALRHVLCPSPWIVASDLHRAA